MDYTLSDYEKDLEAEKWIEKTLKTKSIPKRNQQRNILKIESPIRSYTYNSINERVEKRIRIPDILSQEEIHGQNIMFLRRSYFNLNKFRSTLKSENPLGIEDDYCAPFASLWSQLEYEYKKRLFEPFIPESLPVILNILHRTGRNNNCLREVVDRDDVITFGLINLVIFAIETGVKQGEKKITIPLQKIFGNYSSRFFEKYNVYKCLGYFNRELRNVAIHENKFLSFETYSSACKLLFQQPTIKEWATADNICLFTDYLKILPETRDEKKISEMETLIRKSKLPGTGVILTAMELDRIEQELHLLKLKLAHV